MIKANESNFWEETDGCAKKYKFSSAVHLMTIFSLTLKISIDRAIGDPGHINNVVDGLNARDNIYMREK